MKTVLYAPEGLYSLDACEDESGFSAGIATGSLHPINWGVSDELPRPIMLDDVDTASPQVDPLVSAVLWQVIARGHVA